MITYTVAMPEPHTHLFHVTIDADVQGDSQNWCLPAWTPGSYMIREYARHMQEFEALGDNGPLDWKKVEKHTWRIETGGSRTVQLRYKVYANELTVRTSHLDGSHGYFNPATLALYLPDRKSEPIELRIITPATWRVATGLTSAGELTTDDSSTRTYLFRASDYDELVDCPCECGTHRSLEFTVDDIPHEIAIWGQGNYDETRLVGDTQRIIETARNLFGSLPYERYVFLVLLTDKGGGGLEHRNSVTNVLTHWSFRPEKSYERYLHLTSHEFFHVWNVKRLRAEPLGPFDYQHENYTRQLWAMEGVTSYYDNLLLVRAGLLTPDRYLEMLADQIVQLQSQPGRFVQSLEQSSFDSWIKLYRPDENSANSSISYYLKGALVTLLIDMEIRRITANEFSFDDLLRLLLATYPPDGPGIPEERGYQAVLEELTDQDWSGFFRRFIAGTEELDYAAALQVAGLEPIWGYKDTSADGEVPPWTGIVTKTEHGKLLVSYARSDSPAYHAGVYAGDELLAIDGWRVDRDTFTSRLNEHRVGETITLSLFRRDQLLQVPITLVPAPPDKLVLRQVTLPNPTQQAVYTHWLGLSNNT